MESKLLLDQKLRFCGFRISIKNLDIPTKDLSCFDFDLEETLILAAYEAQEDFRLLSLLATWMTVHGEYVIVEKFFKKLKFFEKYRGSIPTVINLLAAVAVEAGSAKWKKWITCSAKKLEYPVKKSLLESSIAYQGRNEELASYGVLVPPKFLRIRNEDVFTIEELAKNNRQYRNRLIYGASWRADIISAIEEGLANPSVIAKTIGCSYEPSHRIFREFSLARKFAGSS